MALAAPTRFPGVPVQPLLHLSKINLRKNFGSVKKRYEQQQGDAIRAKLAGLTFDCKEKLLVSREILQIQLSQFGVMSEQGQMMKCENLECAWAGQIEGMMLRTL